MNILQLKTILKLLKKSFKLMIGQSDYEAYISHFTQKHLGETPLTEAQFFQENLQRRYRKGSSRCC